ncbi:MAG: sugar kinase [Chloroflexi bacterium]|nr:sugar kinase [Chloroflexota bacterium]
MQHDRSPEVTPMSLARSIARTRLCEILDALPTLSIGVIGDLALDAYWTADMKRSLLSRETPRFPRPVIREFYSPGAGANVAHNLAVMGIGHVSAFSVLGDDWRGRILDHEMTHRGIDTAPIIVSPKRSTTTYIKPILTGYESEQEDARLDFENANPLTDDLEQALVGQITHEIDDLDALLVADQIEVNGVITERVRDALNRLASDHPEKVLAVDSRQRIGLFRNMILKPNWMEATKALYPERDARALSIEALTEIGKRLCKQCGQPVFLTLSESGVLVCTAETCQHIPAAPVRPPLDPVGAGDAFISAAVSAMVAGASPAEAGAIANLAAAVVIEKLNQTGTASPVEILERYDLACSAEERT